ncbi:serpentine type 7TM GPCR receptor class ab chemoreceptor domain-containing protein [Ditylenchus destructor]|uniref:Serpentine type 7TM GPCR receptor class ab chemoreceptor domain-containing protein n=1 Tax=Ditylenchus destructor TaxID=166010 RepID=A0AAD4MIR1_9BILA|nr:serpentine type 7TM GPCR receptor class ab chemoreceptor domain-containing protein [Ditylenchus destructor]
MTNIIILYAVNSVFLIGVQLRYQIPLLLHAEPCDYLTSLWLNIPLRLPSYIYVTAFVLFHFALTTERARATIFARRYEQEGSSYAFFCIIIIWTLTAVINGYMVVLALNDPSFRDKPALYITITAETNASYLICMNFFYLIMVIITATIDYFLLHTNRRNRSKVKDYSLSRSYQINENILIMKLLWPLDICFAVVFAIYLIGTIWIRLIRDKLTIAHFMADYGAITMILPMHSIVTLLLYLNFVKNQKLRVAAVIVPGDPTEKHFEQLESQWMSTQNRDNKAR